MLATAKRLIVSISNKNLKHGNIPTISLPPILTCPPDAPCAPICYALRMYRRKYQPAIAKAWDRNWAIYQNDPEDFFGQVEAWLMLNMPWFFRWHVGGDIPDYEYLLLLVRLARRTPRTVHMFFTKQYDFLIRYEQAGLTWPDNLQPIISVWPGLEVPKELAHYRKAYLDDGSYPVPDTAARCPGKCSAACTSCWAFAELTPDVAFPKH